LGAAHDAARAAVGQGLLNDKETAVYDLRFIQFETRARLFAERVDPPPRRRRRRRGA
jgi:hypothetical protein